MADALTPALFTFARRFCERLKINFTVRLTVGGKTCHFYAALPGEARGGAVAPSPHASLMTQKCTLCAILSGCLTNRECNMPGLAICQQTGTRRMALGVAFDVQRRQLRQVIKAAQRHKILPASTLIIQRGQIIPQARQVGKIRQLVQRINRQSRRG